MPAHLSKAQRNLIFRPTRKKELEAEPIVATLGEEEFPLEHIPQEGGPSILGTFNTALDLMQPKDCDNIPNLLCGLKNAKVRWGYSKLRPIIAMLVKNGREDIIIECLRRVKDTRMQLDSLNRTTVVMHGLIQRAIDNGWRQTDTAKALERVERVAIMIEEPTHAGELPFGSEPDPRNKAEVIGVLLELAAVRASEHLDGKDEDGKVADYASRLVNAAPFMSLEEAHSQGFTLGGWLKTEIYALHSMKVALTVLDPGSAIAVKLKARYMELNEMVNSKRRPGPSDELYQKLLDTDSS